MEILNRRRRNGITSAALRVWGMLFLIAGAVSRCILQNTLLGLDQATAEEMLGILNANSANMAMATAALVMQAAETCAVPVFALLLVEGFLHTKDWKRFLLRVAAAAVVSEIPYDLVTSGSWLYWRYQNPSLALVLGIVMLYLYSRFSQPNAAHRIIKAFVLIAAILWAEMLHIEHGTPVIVMVAVFWLMRNRTNLRGLVAAGAALACTIISPFYLAASMGCLPVHMYNGEPAESSRLLNYIAYPLILVAVYLAATFAF